VLPEKIGQGGFDSHTLPPEKPYLSISYKYIPLKITVSKSVLNKIVLPKYAVKLPLSLGEVEQDFLARKLRHILV